MNTSIRDSYDPGRLAQVFRVEVDYPKAIYTTVVSTEFLRDHSPSTSGTILAGRRLADHLLAAKGADVFVTSWGVDTHER